MKFITIATIITATVGVSVAQPHKHHHHAHKRGDNVVTVYELNGKVISAEEVQQGIANGSLVFENGSDQLQSAPAPAAPAVAPAAKAQVEDVKVAAKPKKHKAQKPPTIPNAAPPAPKASPPELNLPSGSVSDGADSFSMSATGLNAVFPDGKLSCSDFPSKYGALAIPWMNLGGWSGIQAPGSHAGGVIDNIMTKTSGGSCSEGDYCSYACPPGYQKSQWPSSQGATGQSVGGLLCQGGKLHLTNPGLSKSICIKGAEQVNVQVKNTMSQVASVCRTDYPGKIMNLATHDAVLT